jgi:hypothetical protein
MGWTGNGLLVTNMGQISTNVVPLYYPTPSNPLFGVADDAYFTHPTNDWRLLDLFTTALSDSATRGQLSINQTNLAAWSAVLSGVCVLTNAINSSGDAVLSSQVIQPAGVYSPLDTNTWSAVMQIVNGVNGINSVRASLTNKTFRTLGDILAVPALTVASPLMNTSILPGDPNVSYVLNDAAIERIPQQILGLLKCDHTPRFVIYSFGQALKPAPHSIVTGGTFAGLCTNYQIMAEAATRAVVRIDGAPNAPRAVIESYNVLPPD